MAHDHEHHHHSHDLPKNITKAFVIGILLNAIFVIIEAITGFFTHSLSLLTDAGHNLSDVASLALALLANRLALKKPNEQFSFGYRQSTVLVAFINAGILLLALGAIAYEAIIRINRPHEVEGGTVAIVAGIGIIINSVTALMFLKGKDKDLNVKGAYIHMASDALISLGVVISGIIIIYTHWFWLDSVVSLIIVILITWGTWNLLKESLRLTLNGVPKDIEMKKIRNYFLSLAGVMNVHDLHIWAISTTETALTAHLVVSDDSKKELLYANIREELHHTYNISNSTIQIETDSETFHCTQK